MKKADLENFDFENEVKFIVGFKKLERRPIHPNEMQRELFFILEAFLSNVETNFDVMIYQKVKAQYLKYEKELYGS